MKRLNLIFASFFLGFVTFTSCGNSTSETQTSSQAETLANEKKKTKKLSLILDIKTIIGKELSEVEKALGKAEKIEKVNGYPCKNTKCERAYFKKGEIEIIFKQKKADRITIYNVVNLTNNQNALEALGMKPTNPSFQNSDFVIRWQGIEQIHEISFFTDYILVQVTKPE